MDVKKFLENEGVAFDEKLNKRVEEAYKKYKGKQDWKASADGYTPTKKITNLTKFLIDKRARFMFGKEPYFNYVDDEKSELIKNILKTNKFHSKIIKAKKDCSIGTKVAIKLWADKEIGLKIVFVPSREFFVKYNADDNSIIDKIIYLYEIPTDDPEKPHVKKQCWEMVSGKCILNESTHNPDGTLISQDWEDHNTELDFIPSVVVLNGGLTGEVEGQSDVEEVWSNQDAYNKLTSDDMDALKFQMFGQTVATDASEETIKGIVIAPGALIDMQTDPTQSNSGRQAKLGRVESGFSYGAKYQDTRDNIKNDMYDMMSVPNVGIEQLKGVITSGKSMKALYWDLISACEEDWAEWGPALEEVANYIMKMVAVYNLYDSKALAGNEDQDFVIEHYYPIQEDEDDQKKTDLEEVRGYVRSPSSYIQKWQDVDDPDKELEKILAEKQRFELDNYTQELIRDVSEDDEGSDD